MVVCLAIILGLTVPFVLVFALKAALLEYRRRQPLPGGFEVKFVNRANVLPVPEKEADENP